MPQIARILSSLIPLNLSGPWWLVSRLELRASGPIHKKFLLSRCRIWSSRKAICHAVPHSPLRIHGRRHVRSVTSAVSNSCWIAAKRRSIVIGKGFASPQSDVESFAILV